MPPSSSTGALSPGMSRSGLTLWEVAGPVARKVDASWTGLHANDTWSGPTVDYVRRNCSPGVLQVALHSDATLFDRPQTVTATVAGSRWRGFASRHRTTPFSGCRSEPEAGVCRVRFDVSPTAVPGGGDTRRLGVHFDAFNYEPR